MARFFHFFVSKIQPLAAVATKTAMAAALMACCTACQSSYEVSKINPEKDFPTQAHAPGLVYALPSTYYKLQIEGRLKATTKGRLSEFNHLVKYPSGTNKQSKRLLQLDSVALKAYTKPDLQRMYRVKLPENSSGLFSKKPAYKIRLAENLMLAGTNYEGPLPDSIKHPSCHLLNSDITIPEQPMDNQRSKQKSSPFDQQSLKTGVAQLQDLNRELVSQLQSVRKDSVLTNDSVMQVRLETMEQRVDSYLGRIRDIKSLFEAYRGENLAEKAQKFSDIIHKLVELKTTLAGGDAAIDYPNTAITPMIASIDSMIGNYLAPFKATGKTQHLRWEMTFEPSADSLDFQYGIFKSNQGDYYIDQPKGRTNYKALIAVKIKPESLKNSRSSPEKVTQGLVYSIPASAKLKVLLKYPGSEATIPLAQSTITLPQLGPTNTLPAGKGSRHYRLDPFTGALKSVEQNRPK